MNIIAHAENIICIELTCEDMEKLDITYEELDYSNIETRRVLWTLLDEARRELGKDIRLTQKMLIEAIPDGQGGCAIFFTVTDEPVGRNGRKQIVKIRERRTVCQADKIENLTSLAKVLQKNVRLKKSALFTNGSVYRLILQPEPTIKNSSDSLICEYCDIINQNAAAYTYEHWKLLAEPNAVDVLAEMEGW